MRKLTLLFVLAFGAYGQRPMTLVDVMNVPQVSDPQIAPDGKQVLFVESEANWKANRAPAWFHSWRFWESARLRDHCRPP